MGRRRCVASTSDPYRFGVHVDRRARRGCERRPARGDGDIGMQAHPDMLRDVSRLSIRITGRGVTHRFSHASAGRRSAPRASDCVKRPGAK